MERDSNIEKTTTVIAEFKNISGGDTLQSKNEISSDEISDSLIRTNNKTSTAQALAEYEIKQVLEQASSTLYDFASYEFNKSLNLNDDYLAQRNYQIASQQVGAVTSIVSNTLTAAQAGATVGGVWGAAIGAIVGGATSIGQLAYNNWKQQDQQNIRLRIMDAELDFTRQRAGWSTNAASIGEDL